MHTCKRNHSLIHAFIRPPSLPPSLSLSNKLVYTEQALAKEAKIKEDQVKIRPFISHSHPLTLLYSDTFRTSEKD